MSTETHVKNFLPLSRLQSYTPVISRRHLSNFSQVVDIIILSKDSRTSLSIALIVDDKRVPGLKVYCYNGSATFRWNGNRFAAKRLPSEANRVYLYDFRSDENHSLLKDIAGAPILPLSPYLQDPLDPAILALKLSINAPYIKVEADDQVSYIPMLYQELENFEIDWTQFSSSCTSFVALNSHIIVDMKPEEFEKLSCRAESINFPIDLIKSLQIKSKWSPWHLVVQLLFMFALFILNVAAMKAFGTLFVQKTREGTATMQQNWGDLPDLPDEGGVAVWKSHKSILREMAFLFRLFLARIFNIGH